LVAAHALQYGADIGQHGLELLRRELESLEAVAELVHLGNGLLVGSSVLLDQRFSGQELFAQFGEANTGLFRIGAYSGFFLLGIVQLGVVIIFVVGTLRIFLDGFFGLLGERRQHLIIVGGKVAGDDIAEAALLGLHQVVLGKHVGNRAGETGHGLHQLAQTFLDAFGDNDLAFAGQQLHRAHLTHVHAHRVSGAASLVLHGCKRGSCFGRGDFVGIAIAFVHQQGIGIGRGLVDLDAHVIDHLDDVFNLVRIGNGFRQVVIDLSVGKVILFLTLGD